MEGLSEREQQTVRGLCIAHLRDYEDRPQTGVAVDEESADQLRSILDKL